MLHGQPVLLVHPCREILAQPARDAGRQGREDDLVERLAPEHVADRLQGVGVTDLAGDDRARRSEPGHRLRQPRLGRGPVAPFGPCEVLGVVRSGHQHVELTRTGGHAFVHLGRQVGTAQGAVGHHEVATHRLTSSELLS